MRKKHLPPEHLDLASSLHSMGTLRLGQFRAAESASALRESLAIRRKLLGNDHELTDSTRLALSTVVGLHKPGGFRQDARDALSLSKESLAWRRKHFGNTHFQTAVAMLAVVGCSLNEGANAEAAMLLAEGTPILMKNPVTKSIAVAVSQFQQAVLMRSLGQQERATASIRKALAAVRDGSATGHPFALTLESEAIGQLIALGQLDEAASLCREALARNRKFGRPKTLIDADLSGQLSTVLVKQFNEIGDPKSLDEAEELYLDSLSIVQRSRVALQVGLISLMNSIAKPLQARDAARAESLYRRTLDVMREVLIREGELTIDAKLNAAPYRDAVVALGRFLGRNGKAVEAEALYVEALQLVRERKYDSLAVEFMLSLADLKARVRQFDDAEARYKEALALATAFFARQRAERKDDKLDVGWFANAVSSYAETLKSAGRMDEAATLYRESLPLTREHFDEFCTMRMTTNLAAVKAEQQKLDEAEPLYRESVRLVERLPNKKGMIDSGWMGSNLVGLANCLAARDKTSEAEAVYRKSISLREKRPGAAVAGLWKLLHERGDDTEAATLLETVLATPGSDDSLDDWLTRWWNLYGAMKKQGADKVTLLGFVDATQLTLAEARNRLGSKHVDVARLLVIVGRRLCELGEFQQAELYVREGLETRRDVLPATDYRQGSAQCLLGECLIGLARYDEAEPLLLSGYSNLSAAKGPSAEPTQSGVETLVRLYEAWQKPDKAAEYRALLLSDQ